MPSLCNIFEVEMERFMKIILDGMGGDYSPEEIVLGAVEASKLIDHEIIIVGQKELIQYELFKHKFDETKISVVNANEVISCNEAPVMAVRRKKDSSIVKGMNMVKDGEGDVFISAGSTGAILAASLFILGRIRGIDRPALGLVYPVLGGSPSFLVDAGANTECKPNNLMDFAVMGSIYAEKVLGREKPKVGLVNIGTEEEKGNTLTKETYKQLMESELNFIGNVEGRDIPNGVCDVIVTDGFTGNALLKFTEGFALRVFSEIKRRFTQGVRAKVGAIALHKKLVELKEEFDYSEYGGAPILGVKGPVIKMHGSSKALAVKNTILKAIPFVENDVVKIIEDSI